MRLPPAIPLCALLDALRENPGPVYGPDAAPVVALRRAQLIYAVGRGGDEEALVFGAVDLDRPLPLGMHWATPLGMHWATAVVRVAVGPDPGDFARLLEVVAAVRGRHDYAAAPPGPAEGCVLH